MTMRVLTIILLLGLCVSGCVKPAGRSLDELASADGNREDYLIRSGDRLDVRVWGEPRVSGEVSVREDGRLTLPLIEEVEADGKTIKELVALITQQLQEFIPSASVTVSVLQSAPVRYFLVGNFLRPGEYRSEGRITLLQAVATGGGFAPFADESSITLIRQAKAGEIRYNLDYNLVIEGAEPNPLLKSGDTVNVN